MSGHWVALLAVLLGAAAPPKYVESPSVLCLDTGNTAMALLVDGSAVMTVEQGDVQVNSGHIHSLFMGSEGTLVCEDGEIHNVGGMAWHGRRIDPQPRQGQGVDDPFAFVRIPAIDDVQSQQNVWVNEEGPLTLKPGVYYGGLTLGRGVVATLEPGLYAFVDGDLWVQAGATVRGEGVCLLFVGDNAGTLNVQGETRIELSAPDEGPLAGFVFGATAEDPLLIWGGEHQFDGLMYAPKGYCQFLTGSTSTIGGIVCRTLKVSLNVKLTVTGDLRVPVPEEEPAEADGR